MERPDDSSAEVRWLRLGSTDGPRQRIKIVDPEESLTGGRRAALEDLARQLEEVPEDVSEIESLNCPIVDITTCEILVICTGVSRE